MSSFGRTAAAMVCAAAIGAYIYFVESKKDPATVGVAAGEDGAAKKKEKLFPSLDKAKAKSLTIEHQGGETIVAGKDGDSWNLRRPKVTAGDMTEVTNLLDSFASLETDEIVSENETDLAAFGLSNPRVVVTVEAEGAPKPFKFAMGDAVPAGSGVYGRVPDSPRVFTIASYLEGSFNKRAMDLRDRTMLKVKREALRRVEVSGRTGFTLVRGDGAEAEWSIERPAKTRAARWTVDSFLGLIENLKMDAVEADETTSKDLARTGLASPQASVAMTSADGSKSVLDIGAKTDDNKYFARVRDAKLIARIPVALFDDIAKGVRNVRMTRLLDVATYEVTSVDVEMEGATKTFTKSTTKDDKGGEITVWKGTAPTKDAPQDKMSDALFAIGGNEGVEFIDTPKALSTYGLDKPALRVKIRFEAGKPEDWFEVAILGDAGYGRRHDDGAVLKLDQKKTEEMIASFKALGS